ncbi:hypothetical protein CVT26_009098 [Gymnopilus dilepis]|uniref:Uncharacterized protein n=1 Tax=Gymnopilus dilepis TaxID=231916 RepID=A0A409WCJ1_9AGAR|nr:hypothetical protein CVT26_009098 [Gymnopilus dilepis]
MTQTADGYIKSSASGSRFTATFIIDGIQYHFSGSLGIAMQPFTCNNAMVTFSKLKSLTSTREYEGRIGERSVNLTIGNGVKISGDLDMPISPANSVAGVGAWTTDFSAVWIRSSQATVHNAEACRESD